MNEQAEPIATRHNQIAAPRTHIPTNIVNPAQPMPWPPLMPAKEIDPIEVAYRSGNDYSESLPSGVDSKIR